MKEEDYMKRRSELLACIALMERLCEEREAFAEKMRVKADALEAECARKERYISELTSEIEEVKRSLGIIR